MTTISEHLAAKRYPPIVEQAKLDGEIAMVDGKYVHACPLPDGYLEQKAKVIELQQRRLTAQTRFVAADIMREGGYTSPKEFSAAQMREQARWIDGNDLPLPRVLTDTLQSNERPKREPRRKLRRVKNEAGWTFHPDDLDVDPLELISVEDQQLIMDQTRLAARILEGTADWDGALTIAPLKMLDSMLLYGCERIIENITVQGQRLNERMAAEKAQMPGEVTNNRIEVMEGQRLAFRIQIRHFQLMRRALLAERPDMVSRSGVEWEKYLSLKERAERGAQAWRQQKSRDSARLEKLRNMPEQEYRKWLRSQKPYEPRHDGIDAAAAEQETPTDG